MENAADALKIGFALLVFVSALSIVFSMVSKVKSTADAVLYYSDETNFRAHIDARTEADDGADYRIRTVKKSDVISSIYRYYKETMAVTVVVGSNEYIFDKGNEKYEGVERKLNTEEQIENNIQQFITEVLNVSADDDDRFREEFVEVPISGEYLYGEDGSEIVLTSGGNKVYITYTLL